MILKDIIQSLDASIIYLADETILQSNFTDAFASDLMSDALALISENNETTLFITGLANTQALRTAEMLDLLVILYVRDKQVSDDMLATAKRLGISLLGVSHTMYTTCGKLYTKGLGIKDD